MVNKNQKQLRAKALSYTLPLKNLPQPKTLTWEAGEPQVQGPPGTTLFNKIQQTQSNSSQDCNSVVGTVLRLQPRLLWSRRLHPQLTSVTPLLAPPRMLFFACLLSPVSHGTVCHFSLLEPTQSHLVKSTAPPEYKNP